MKAAICAGRLPVPLPTRLMSPWRGAPGIGASRCAEHCIQTWMQTLLGACVGVGYGAATVLSVYTHVVLEKFTSSACSSKPNVKQLLANNQQRKFGYDLATVALVTFTLF